MSDIVQEVELSKEVDALVEKLTTSGHPELDQDQLRRVKHICKRSDEHVRKCFHGVMIQLEKEHAEIRLSSVQLINVLFNRSHCFRDMLLADFQYFMELTIETNGDFPLPPPKQTARTLKSKTIEYVHNWHDKFGDAYKKLALGYNFLKNCRKVNFEDVHARSIAEQQREEERIIRTETQQRERIKKAVDEMTEMTNEIKLCLTQADNCLLLLLPDPGNFQIPGLSSSDIFHQQDPWKQNQPIQRHVNKSTKSKAEHSKPVCVKVEAKDDGDGDIDGNTAMSIHTNASQNDANVKNHEIMDSKTDCTSNICANNYNEDVLYNEDGLTTDLCQDVKPSVAELEEAMNANQTGTQQRKPALVNMENDNSNDSGEFHEISSEESDDEMSEEEEVDVNDSMRGHGISSQVYNITINVSGDSIQIEENTDNEDILMTLRDCLRLTETKLLPAIQKWLEVFAKRGAEQIHIKRALDLKEALTKMKEKISKLKIVTKPREKRTVVSHGVKKEDDSEDDDDDFEEVTTKEGYEPDIPEHLREEYGLVQKALKPPTNPDWQMPCASHDDEEDPTSCMSTLKRIQQKMKQEPQNISAGPDTSGSSGDKKPRLDDVPVVPFGTDLYHWGEKMETPLMVRYDTERFWISKSTEDTVDVNALASMKSRVINFVGKFEPVKWTCRAPLPNGKLCPRMDRYKCPFHGKVIPRDQVGQPSNVEDKIKIEQKEEKKHEDELPEWDDPELQADILAATGIDLARKGKKKCKGKKKHKDRQKKYPGLTDIRVVSNPIRNRLERKIMNRNAVRRVADAMNGIDEKKRKDKFGNSFHYVHGPRKT